MASLTPAVQNENFYIHRGKGAKIAKADLPKPVKKGLQDRKALRDLSNTGKPLLSRSSKGNILKEKSVVCVSETTKNVSRSGLLSTEEIERSRDWAKEGIEQIHFPGNAMQKLQQDEKQECVKKKVEKASSSLRQWTDVGSDIGRRPNAAHKNIDEIIKLELEPEVLPPTTSLLSASDSKEIDDLLPEPELDHQLSLECTLELKPKDEYHMESEMDTFKCSLLAGCNSPS